MGKLSVAFIVKNEEELFGQCLESLKGVWDELVVVDTGSTDSTLEIAKKYGAKIRHFEWNNDFAAARNYAEDCCSGDYIYWQDADEILLEGKEAIREVVDAGQLDGLAPFLIFSRGPDGKPSSTYFRQEMLHKNIPVWRWHGAAHNWLTGTGRYEEPRIVVEHLNRPSGDRPNHEDIFDALRSNLYIEGAPAERSLFYLAREHFYKRHYHETLALLGLMLQSPVSWPTQRARGCVIAGDCWKALEKPEKAAQAYLKSIEISATSAEAFFSLGKLRYEQKRWLEAVAWLKASTPFEPGGYFCDRTIYEWRRWDLLAVCLSKLGRNEEAVLYGAKALLAKPEDARLKRNQEYYEKGAGECHGTT
jgi:glycosyltransferase involved in cell wall biosynthesis